MTEIKVQTNRREEMVDVTSPIQQAVTESGCQSGLLFCYVPHTTAGITINEGADPDVSRDILDKLGRLVPRDEGYHHMEGNSDAHIKASLMGASEQVLIENGRLVLGRWQGIFFCEFDGPRSRRLIVRVFPFA